MLTDILKVVKMKCPKCGSEMMLIIQQKAPFETYRQCPKCGFKQTEKLKTSYLHEDSYLTTGKERFDLLEGCAF